MAKEINYDEYQKFLANLESGAKNPRILKALKLLNGKWKLVVIYRLFQRKKYRFLALRKEIPEITNAVLISTLRDLESIGVVKRVQYNEVPSHVEYSLTEKGFSLLPVLFELSQWGDLYL